MKNAQITLKLFLDALEISPDVTTLEDRKKVQKAVYIGQTTGADLGYTYGWYLLGPYSPELTQDYFTLDSDLMTGDDEYKIYKLVESFSNKLKGIRKLMDVPPRVNLPQEDWLELLASIIYKMKETNDVDKTRKFLSQEKPHLRDHIDDAFKHCGEYGLIS